MKIRSTIFLLLLINMLPIYTASIGFIEAIRDQLKKNNEFALIINPLKGDPNTPYKIVISDYVGNAYLNHLANIIDSKSKIDFSKLLLFKTPSEKNNLHNSYFFITLMKFTYNNDTGQYDIQRPYCVTQQKINPGDIIELNCNEADYNGVRATYNFQVKRH